MKGTLVFDNLNDIIYLNCCTSFVKHVAKLASTQGLVASEHSTPYGKGKKAVDPNILVQLFAPLVTSQRFMREQFGNPYTSVQCEDGTNIVFQEYMGFLFLRIGTEEMPFLRRALGVAITLVSYVCGPDVSILKLSPYHANLLDQLLLTWTSLYTSDQSFMIEAVEQMNVNPQLNSNLVKSLQQITDKIQSQVGNHVHALLFLDTKLLSWYSTRNAIKLGPEDLLFLILLCQKTWKRSTFGNFQTNQRDRSSSAFRRETVSTSSDGGEANGSTDNESSTGFHSSREDLLESLDQGDKWDVVDENNFASEDEIAKYLILLKSDYDTFIPQSVHIGSIQDGLYLVILNEPPTGTLTTASCTALQQASEFHGRGRDAIGDRQAFDQLDIVTKKLQELLKKQKNLNLRNETLTRWDRFKVGMLQYFKTKDPISVQASPLVDIYREIFRSYFNEKPSKTGEVSSMPLDNVWKQIKSDTEDFWGFLKVKANQNLTLESRESLAINKYLEEFPGLVHFIYIDRNKHTVIMPNLDFTREETIKLTKTKIWAMVKFARDHMQQGHFSIMWKDSAFNYAYFLWFEDISGTPIRAKQPAMPWEGYPLPGILCGDFYKRVMVECFPNLEPSKVRCLELFCIHLGLATSSCVLEHSKRLATNIFDETGGNPASDLL